MNHNVHYVTGHLHKHIVEEQKAKIFLPLNQSSITGLLILLITGRQPSSRLTSLEKTAGCSMGSNKMVCIDVSL